MILLRKLLKMPYRYELVVRYPDWVNELQDNFQYYTWKDKVTYLLELELTRDGYSVDFLSFDSFLFETYKPSDITIISLKYSDRILEVNKYKKSKFK